MEINKEILQNALEMCKSGLASKEIIQQSTSFCFMNKKIITYNDTISVCYPIDLDITAAVSAEELYNFVSKCTVDTLIVNESENELIFKAGRAKSGLIKQSEIILPLETINEKKVWKRLPPKFLDSIQFCMSVTSKETSNFLLTGIHINKNKLESSDGYRIAECALEENLGIETIISGNICVALLKFQPIKISLGESWVHFENKDKGIFSCRIIEGKYPDISPYMFSKGLEIKFPKLGSLIEKASIFSKRTFQIDEMVEILIENGKLKIKSTSETGWYEETTKIDYSGEPLTLLISPYLIKNICNEETTTLYEKNKLLFTGGNWKYLIMLKLR